jgi:PAT family beta-lactamase induction signal transducer AmpG
VYFRQQGVELRQIGVLSLLGLAWTLKFLWAPAIDYWRHHRRFMAAVDVAMGCAMLYFAMQVGFGPMVWVTIGVFTALSATNDIAIDGYTIEVPRAGRARARQRIRIGLYRVGMLASGFVLMASGWLGLARGVRAFGRVCSSRWRWPASPRRASVPRTTPRGSVRARSSRRSRARPRRWPSVAGFVLGVLWLIDGTTKWSERIAAFWVYAVAGVALAVVLVVVIGRLQDRRTCGRRRPFACRPAGGSARQRTDVRGADGAPAPARDYAGAAFHPRLQAAGCGDGFMVKPFWVDVGFSAAQIGLVSVNIGLALSIAGGIVGGWITDRIGIFSSLWILGPCASRCRISATGSPPASFRSPRRAGACPSRHMAILYAASATEVVHGRDSALPHFLAFLMAIVEKERAATEYALLSVGVRAVALGRRLGGRVGGASRWVMEIGFLLTFFLAAPAYLLLAVGAADAESETRPTTERYSP